MDSEPRDELTTFETAGGVRVTRTAGPFDPDLLADVSRAVDERRGGVLSSGMEYPGRYSRWHIAYADPCVEIVARGRRIGARALNDRGRVVLPVIGAALQRAGTLDPDGPAAAAGAAVQVVIPEPDRAYTEEERSRRPTVFTALREVIAAFRGEDSHLGLYGAFGYDLAFQFEPVRLNLERPADQRDLVLHLPDEIYVLDRKREQATRYAYEFEAGGVSTAGLPRRTERHRRSRRAATGGAGPARTAQARLLRPGGGRGQGAVRARRPVRGRARPRVLRPVPAPVGVLRAATAAQPGAVRVHVQPRGGGVPGRRVTGDVRPGHRRPGGDLPDLRHDAPGARARWRTRRTSARCSGRPRRSPS